MASLAIQTLKARVVRRPDAGPTVAQRLGRAIASAVKQVHYGRQMQALGQFTDDQLTEIGLRRSEIPAYAHRLIYGGD